MSFRPLQTGGASYIPPNEGMVSVEAPRFTCVACGLVFSTSSDQQAHFRTDLHIYNLRRKVLDYPPVTEEEFIAIQKEELEKQKGQVGKRSRCSVICEACNKSFSSEAAYKQHCKTKKHRESVDKTKKATARIVSRNDIKPIKRRNAKNPVAPVAEVPLPEVRVFDNNNNNNNNNNSKHIIKEKEMEKVTKEESKDIEDIYGEGDSNSSNEEEEEYEETDLFEGSEETKAWKYIGKCIETGSVKPEEIDDLVWDLILSKRPRFTDDECPFCSHHESDFEELLKHMELNHDFRIPDREYCIDEQAVLFYVQDKIAVGRQCLYCGRIFGKVKNLRDHMNALIHTRFAMGKYNNSFEDKAILKYYDYSRMWDAAYEKGKEAQSKLGLIKDKLLCLLPGIGNKNKNLKSERRSGYDERFGLPKSFLRRTKFVPSSNVGMTVLGITKDEETKELILPDGKVIGHRDLKKYYEQDSIGLKALVSSEMAARKRREAYLKGNTTSSCTDIVLAPSVSESRKMYLVLDKNRYMAQFKAHKLIKHFVDQNMVYQVPK